MSFSSNVKNELAQFKHSKKTSCCRRAFLKGCFLACGTVSDPAKTYHLEFSLPSRHAAELIKETLQAMDLHPKINKNRDRWLVYFKEAESIILLLNLMGAYRALMAFEDIRIRKSINNTINRRHNFDLANLDKTAAAAGRQLRDIQYIAEHAGLESLPSALATVARLRLEFPEASLAEIGSMLTPPIGKSGVNHRLRNLDAVARRLREGAE